MTGNLTAAPLREMSHAVLSQDAALAVAPPMVVDMVESNAPFVSSNHSVKIASQLKVFKISASTPKIMVLDQISHTYTGFQ